jgi:hypothetical protein
MLRRLMSEAAKIASISGDSARPAEDSSAECYLFLHGEERAT